jgi:hypothetical protein
MLQNALLRRWHVGLSLVPDFLREKHGNDSKSGKPMKKESGNQ